MKLTQEEKVYLRETRRSHHRRIQWWREQRFGMFIHWGLYSQLARQEWVMNRECIPIREYEKLASTWNPGPCPAREWARLAKKAGMKYMVMTAKHHEGFLLWDSQMSRYNAMRQGPKRDLVREYVDAARAEGLRVGLYYSLMDWHHPDGARCVRDHAARKRFLDYTKGCVRELCSNYGKIDILWYDVAHPLRDARAWDSVALNRMVRELQPDILINNRSHLPEDFGTPEGHVQAEDEGRDWEACMPFNYSWGWLPTPSEDWRGVREVLGYLRIAAAGCGNLLLNIGPKPDGSVPEEAVERLTRIGKWLDRNGAAVYGKTDRIKKMEWMALGNWSRKGLTYYYWVWHWPGSELSIGGLTEKVKSARLLPDGKRLRCVQQGERLRIQGMPEQCPDPFCEMAVLELKFDAVPRQRISLPQDQPGVKPGRIH